MTRFQKAVAELGGRASITGSYRSVSDFGEARPGETPRPGHPMDRGVVARFPNGYRMEAGYRMVDAGPAGPGRLFVGAPRRAPAIWEDAEKDLLDHMEAWYGPDGILAPCPVGDEFSSLDEFVLKACASGVFAV